MPEINYFAVGLATVLAFLVGALWNSPLLFGHLRASLAGLEVEQSTPALAPVTELIRCLVLVLAFALVLRTTGSVGLPEGLGVAVLIWLGFQANLLMGAVIWERMPLQLYAVHAGDALVKALLVSATLALWR